MLLARKEGDEASKMGFRKRIDDVGKPHARRVVCHRVKVLSMNGRDVTTACHGQSDPARSGAEAL
jgi:hypothetical protein